MSIIIYGKNAVRESVASGRAEKVKALAKWGKDPIVAEARKRMIPVEFASESELTRMARNPSHQGFAAICKDFSACPFEDFLSLGKKEPLLLMLDGIEDPHNMGAILRSADAFGVDGVIIKKRGNAPLNATVAKISTGAINYVKVAEVANLSFAIKKLKEAGYWIVSSDGEAKASYDEVDYHCPICLIVGSEGFGISRLLLENSDFVVKIPMYGHVNSLNASVATGIFLSFISHSRAKPLAD